MRFWACFILVGAVLAAGCAEPVAQRDSASVEGVTLGELMPPERTRRASVMHFWVQMYVMDTDHAAAVRECYTPLSEGGIRFLDYQAFVDNGFFAAMGIGSQAGPLADCLRRMGARQYGQANLVTDAGEETPFWQVYIDKATVSYTAVDEGQTEITLLDGDLSWSLTARLDPTLPDRIRVRIRPVFLPRGLKYWPGAERLTQQMTSRFSEGRLDVSLRPAEFVVLATQHDTLDELTPLERLLFTHHEGREARLRLFVIMFIKAEL
jgi:hypothetical protein